MTITSLVSRVLDRIRRARVPSFSSYEEAIEAVSGSGYVAADLVRVVRDKTERYREALESGNQPKLGTNEMSLLAAIGLCHADNRNRAGGDTKLRVIDFGGACGRDFFTASSLGAPFGPFEWHVVETEEMAIAAKPLSGNGLKFFSSFDEAIAGFSGRPDLLLSTGTLQYLPDPWKTINCFVESGATYLLISRLILSSEADDLFTVQRIRLSENGPGEAPAGFEDRTAEVALTILSRDSFKRALATKYSLIELEANNEVFYGPGGKTFRYSGYFGRMGRQ